VWGDDSFKPAYIKHLRAIFGDDHILENQNKWADLLHTVLNDLGDESCGYLTEWFQEDVEMPECVKMGIDLYNEEMYPFEDVVGWFFNMTQPSINMNGADMFYTFFVITLFIIVITGLILDRQIKALRNSMHDKYGTKPTDDETIGKLP
jgi:hypothetical protein